MQERNVVVLVADSAASQGELSDVLFGISGVSRVESTVYVETAYKIVEERCAEGMLRAVVIAAACDCMRWCNSAEDADMSLEKVTHRIREILGPDDASRVICVGTAEVEEVEQRAGVAHCDHTIRGLKEVIGGMGVIAL